MRIAILTHYFPPEVGAPQRRLQALARGLAATGAEVSVHTCAPHYPEGVVHPTYRNSLRPSRSRADEVELLRSFVLPAANRGVGRRLLDHASFALSASCAAPSAGAVDVVVAETPPLFLAAAAPFYARVRGARLVLHVSDLWPDSAVAVGAIESEPAIALARLLERHAYRRATAIVAPTRGIELELTGRPEAAAKVRRISPAVDTDRFEMPPLRRDGPLRVLYAGTVGMAQGLGTLVEAARRVGGGRVRVTIAGAGAELDEITVAAGRAGNVRVLGAVDADTVTALYRDADAAVVLLRDRPIFRGALPTKTLEAMAAGRPLLLSAAGEAAEFVSDAGAGVVVPPEDVDALAHAMVGLAAMPEAELRAIGARGVAHAAGFARPAMIAAWSELLSDVVSDRG